MSQSEKLKSLLENKESQCNSKIKKIKKKNENYKNYFCLNFCNHNFNFIYTGIYFSLKSTRNKYFINNRSFFNCG